MNRLLSVVFIISLFASNAFSQSLYIANQLVELNANIIRLESLLKESTTIAESTSVFLQQSKIMTEKLVEFTESNVQLTEQLVKLGKDNKTSSSIMLDLTKWIFWLTIVLAIIAFSQLIELLSRGYTWYKNRRKDLASTLELKEIEKEKKEEEPIPQNQEQRLPDS